MPLIQINYSANLDGAVKIKDLVDNLHDAGLKTGAFPVAALRTMAVPMRDYAIADRDPNNAFVHLVVRMRKRNEQERKAIGDAIFGALAGFMDAEFSKRPLSLSLELIDIDTWRKNNIHDKLK